jgi:hypothetical protein
LNPRESFNPKANTPEILLLQQLSKIVPSPKVMASVTSRKMW